MFTKNSPINGDIIYAEHIQNIENYLSPINYINYGGSTTTGVVKFYFNEQFIVSGNATTGMTFGLNINSNNTFEGLDDINFNPSASGKIYGLYWDGTNYSDYEIVTGATNPSSGGNGALIFPAIYTYLYDDLIQEYMITSTYEASGFLVDVYNTPSVSGEAYFDIYLNNNILVSGMALSGTVSYVDYDIVTGLVYRDKIKFHCTSVSEETIGNYIFFGIK